MRDEKKIVVENTKCLILRDDNFEQVVPREKGLFVVSFWAYWSAPCYLVDQAVEEAASGCAPYVRFGKMNVVNNTRIPTIFGVFTIPQVLFFKDGVLVDFCTGAVTAAELVEKSGFWLNFENSDGSKPTNSFNRKEVFTNEEDLAC